MVGESRDVITVQIGRGVNQNQHRGFPEERLMLRCQRRTLLLSEHLSLVAYKRPVNRTLEHIVLSRRRYKCENKTEYKYRTLHLR